MTWNDIVVAALEECTKYPAEYKKRLDFEIKEIDKQGASDYWVDEIAASKKYDTNKNGLVLPFLMRMTSVDPIASNIQHVVEYQTDFPDVDIDLLPGTREKIEQYAAQVYGRDKVCSVGLWQTYKPKLALQDAARALGKDVDPVITLTKNLPDEFDELEYEEAIKDHPEFKKFALEHKEIVGMAYRMVGGIKAQGRHAGGLIISNVPIEDHIPLTLCSERWTSAWTEGRTPQLSKMGFVKFDMLGLKTLLYIKTCLKLIKQNRGMTIEWTDIDPELDRAGWLIDEKGNKSQICLNDPASIAMAHQTRTETVFQFETNLAKRILMNGVKSFDDLVVYTSLGRPGPMPMIDIYVKRRDGLEEWEKDEHPVIVQKLKKTFGVIVYQEDLAEIWRSIGGFTAPETEAARKAVAKKWVEKLVPIKEKWIRGASKTLSTEVAAAWWDKMETFGRYAFNKSHATAYIIVAQRCLYLKAHFPAEWWAAVMSDCDNDRLASYMGHAKADDVSFGSMDCDKLTMKFSASDNIVTPGLTSIKNMDSKMAEVMTSKNVIYKDIDDFIEQNGKSKIVYERLIKLGAFDKKNKNRKACWIWYQYQYGTDEDSKEIRKLVKCAYAWPLLAIESERQRQAKEFYLQYPKRKVLPPKIAKWVPKVPWQIKEFKLPDSYDETTYEFAKSLQLTREHVMAVVPESFLLEELLKFERGYLGYTCHSPMDLYIHDTEATIVAARENGILEVYIDKFTLRKKNTEFGELIVTDGIDTARVMVWGDDLVANGDEIFKEGRGVRLRVNWKDKFKSFNLKNGSIAIPLDRSHGNVS
jgi:DNA polymerase III alpha subunit